MKTFEIPYSQEIMADVLDTPVTDEPMDASFPEGLDTDMVENLHDLAYTATPFATTELQKAIKRFPTVPCLKNYLAVTLALQHKDKQAIKANELLLEQHPDYLFGRVAVAMQRVRKGRLDEALELLGPSLRLRDLYPETKVFHLSEVKSYYHTAGFCHLAAWNFDACQGIIKALEQLDDDLPEVKSLQWACAEKGRQRLSLRIAEDERTAIHVRETEIPDDDYPAKQPSYQHEEMDWLYEFGYEMSADKIRQILGLPRASLVADLKVMLEDLIRISPACYWDDDLRSVDEKDERYPVALNALHVLAELKATEITETVLEFFSQNSKLLEMWLGEKSFAPLLGPHVEASLGRLAAWMKQPGVSAIAREGISEAAVQLVLRVPARRAEVIAWFADLLEYFTATPPEDNILDTRLVSSLVWDVCDLRATELLPWVRKLYDLQRVSEMQVGTYDELAKDAELPLDDGLLIPTQPMEEYYRKTNRERNPPEILRGGVESLMAHKPPARDEPVIGCVGRNDPCPCGSGKKFKKCCM